MSMKDCIQRAADGKEISRNQAEAAQAVFDDLKDRYLRAGMAEPMAEALAASDLVDATKAAARRRFHAVVTQLRVAREIREAILNSDDPAVAVRNLIERSEGSDYKGKSVESLRRQMVGDINFQIRQFLNDASRNLVGESRNKARVKNVWRELHGQKTDDPNARQMAEAIREIQEELRRRFNMLGGDIGKLDDYGVTHTHDAAQMMKRGFDDWSKFVGERLDWARIKNFSTDKPFVAKAGQRPDAETEARFLRDIWNSITSDGWATREASMGGGAGKALYDQRADHRVLHFKDADASWDYNQRFGGHDPFSAIVGGLHVMARDIAQMEVLGPNPRAGLEFAIQVAEKRVAEGLSQAAPGADVKRAQKAAQRVRSNANVARAMLAHVNGTANVPQNIFWASFFGGARNLMTSAYLGSATISAVTDAATIRTAAKVVGMNPTNVMSTYTALMARHATRETAQQMGYIAETLGNSGAAAARYLGDTFGPEITSRFPDFTLRASGLSHHTDMAKTAFRMEFSGYLASLAGNRFDQLDAPLRKIMGDRGITAADWDALRAPEAMFTAPNGAKFITPSYWKGATDLPATRAEDLASRLGMIIEEQIEFAVPTANLEGRARLMGATQPGTFYGELLRSGMMFKSFALSLTLNQYRRFMAIPTGMGRLQYAAGFGVPLILLGALAMQLKSLAQGKDTRPMDDPKFWLAAVAQAGALGIFGDFLFSETSRSGAGLAGVLAGPVVQLGGDVISIPMNALTRVAAGQEPLIGRDVAKLAERNTPVMSSLWYSRLAYDRAVSDNLARFLDPEAEDQFRRQIRRAEREFEAPFWWLPGEGAPRRGPDLSNMAGDLGQ